jgi:hypothetical protein
VHIFLVHGEGPIRAHEPTKIFIAVIGFLKFKARSCSPLSASKNIGDYVGRQGQSIGTPLDPSLLWLDNILQSMRILNPWSKPKQVINCR